MPVSDETGALLSVSARTFPCITVKASAEIKHIRKAEFIGDIPYPHQRRTKQAARLFHPHCVVVLLHCHSLFLFENSRYIFIT